eukprot:TRINITY_DN25985_c0_g1_i1.p1 TRINITY_DN25985_c0_g1~~TRINITY_DN25985_c0_g1_i1.p1  ORF type:complete len:506 (-),score=133.29 TRINITY_DN25985_c0_g1_i1:57-1574(-)
MASYRGDGTRLEYSTASSVRLQQLHEPVTPVEARRQFDELQLRGSSCRSLEERGYADVRPEAQMDEWATYGSQLRAWVGLQVDEHLSRMLPSALEARLTPVSEAVMDLRRECSSVRLSSERMEVEHGTLREERARTWSQLEAELQRVELKAIHSRQDLVNEITDRLEAELQRVELKAIHSRQDLVNEITDRIRASSVSTASEEAEARRQLERRLVQRFELLEEQVKVSRAPAEVLGADKVDRLAAKLEALDVDVARLRQVPAEVERLVARSEAIADQPQKMEKLSIKIQELTSKWQTVDSEVNRLSRVTDAPNPQLEEALGKVKALDLEMARLSRAKAATETNFRQSQEALEVRLQARLGELESTFQDSKADHAAIENRLLRLDQLPNAAEGAKRDLEAVAARLDVRLEQQLSARLNARFEEHNTWLDGEFTRLKQTLLVLVRTEMAKAFRSEAAAITALDQQLKLSSIRSEASAPSGNGDRSFLHEHVSSKTQHNSLLKLGTGT